MKQFDFKWLSADKSMSRSLYAINQNDALEQFRDWANEGEVKIDPESLKYSEQTLYHPDMNPQLYV
ncbi:MAG: hypothetical protein F4153_10520 [Acidimicrobiia bacterium]|nr:hypothetical protein [Acidimicrobiia bacterium]